MRRLLVFALVLVAMAGQAVGADPAWRRVKVEGTPLTLEVPAGRLQPAATTGDKGRAIYRSSDGAIEVLAFGDTNFDEATADTLRQADLDSLDIDVATDTRLPDGYLIAGTERTEARGVYRRRVILGADGGRIFVIEVTYPAGRAFAAEAERITASASLEEPIVVAAPTAPLAPPQQTTPTTPSAGAGRRVALVIGNGAYRYAPALPTPANDARVMAERLQALGFEVITGTDVERAQMSRLLAAYADRLAGAGVALFYYSGHGIQVDGHNYLLPIDADFTDRLAAFDVEARGYDLQKFLSAGALAHISVAIIDACRDNPLAETALNGGPAKSIQGGGPTKGLAVIPRETVGRGQFISFAAEPGHTAETGEGATSVFTQAFLDASREPGLDVSVLFRRVRARVEQVTNGRQSPRYVDDLTDSFVLNAPPSP